MAGVVAHQGHAEKNTSRPSSNTEVPTAPDFSKNDGAVPRTTDEESRSFEEDTVYANALLEPREPAVCFESLRNEKCLDKRTGEANGDEDDPENSDEEASSWQLVQEDELAKSESLFCERSYVCPFDGKVVCASLSDLDAHTVAVHDGIVLDKLIEEKFGVIDPMPAFYHRCRLVNHLRKQASADDDSSSKRTMKKQELLAALDWISQDDSLLRPVLEDDRLLVPASFDSDDESEN